MSSSNSSGTTPAAPPSGSSIASQLASRRTSPKTKYLIIYNAISAGLWATILWHVLTHAYPRPRPTDLYASTGTFARWTQTLALLEIVHALLGVVRAGVFTTGLQVASRVTLIWWIVEFYDVKSEPAYVSMLGAWSVTEVVRYCYFVVSLTGQVPGFLIWLRYVLPLFFIYTFESFMSSLSRAFYSSRCVMWLHFACFIRFLAD
jgi:very-long-chain (3R)-3-hydroxyacyl-CoA dehydratase